MLQEIYISLQIALAQLQIELNKKELTKELTIEKELIDKEITMEEKYLDKLINCESQGNETAVNLEDAKINKLPSFGILQFSPYTLLNAAKRYGLVPQSFTLKEILAMRFNSSFQKEVARKLLADGGWAHWRTCSKRIGLDKIAFNY